MTTTLTDHTGPTGTEGRVCNDIALRQWHGLAKYGTTVEANPLTLRQWLQHAYEEALDQAIYLRRAIEQIDAEEAFVAALALSTPVTAFETTTHPEEPTL